MITEEMGRVALRAYNEDCNGCTAQAPALRRAITAALAAMWQDHVIVPREATEEMIDAACVAQIALYPAWEGQKPSPTAGEVIATVYRAMVSAAPTLLSTRMGSEKMAEG